MVVGLRVRKCKVGEGAGAKSHETKHNGSVLGTPCKMVVDGNVGM
jgi:hypothetical protein